MNFLVKHDEQERKNYPVSTTDSTFEALHLISEMKCMNCSNDIVWKILNRQT